MEAGNERLFRVLSEVGSDLIATAEQKRFARSSWRRILPAAACLLLIVGIGLAAAPYLVTVQRPETAASAPAAEPARKDGVPETAVSVEEPATERSEAPAVNQKTARALGETKQQLVFWDTVYYVEAQYTEEETALLLGDLLGAVAQADEPSLLEKPVYSRVGSETREDGKERQIPLEIFVKNEGGYLYCLTYYHSGLPLMDWTELQYHWENGLFTELMELLVLPVEESLLAADLELSFFGQAGELTSEQLLHFFLITLQMERNWGTRTEDLDRYLWEYADGYLIMPEDVTRQLSRYLDLFTFDAETLDAYDPALGGIRLDTLKVETSDRNLTMQVEEDGFELDEANKRINVTFGWYDEAGLVKSRYYSICFREDRMVYASIGTHSDVLQNERRQSNG